MSVYIASFQSLKLTCALLHADRSRACKSFSVWEAYDKNEAIADEGSIRISAWSPLHGRHVVWHMSLDDRVSQCPCGAVIESEAWIPTVSAVYVLMWCVTIVCSRLSSS